MLQRLPDQDGTAQEQLAGALSALYAYLYCLHETDVELPARERAGAMVLFDRWVAAGCPPSSYYLKAEGSHLVRSYAALLAAVYG